MIKHFESWMSLNEDIWKQATKDEDKIIKRNIFYKLRRKGYEEKKADEIIRENKNMIENECNKFVYEESLRFPENNKGETFQKRKKCESDIIEKMLS